MCGAYRSARGRAFYLGDGDTRIAGPTITQIAGIDTAGFSGDGGPANQAKVWDPFGLDVGPDGALYFADRFNRRIRRIAPNGIITTVAGTGVAGFSGDGGPATQAQLRFPTELAFGPDGSFYFADQDISVTRIRRVDPAGVITTVAGGGSAPCDRSIGETCGDGGPALQAVMGVLGMDVGSDGTIYIADGWNVIRRIGPDGIIHRIAGDSLGDFCHYTSAPDPTCGDGGPAAQAKFDTPTGIGVGPDGSVFIADASKRVRRIAADGVIQTVAGNRTDGSSGDGGPAVLAQLRPDGIAVDADGSLLVLDMFSAKIRRVGTDGIIRTIGGTGVLCQVPFSVNCPAGGAPAAQVRMKRLERITVSPTGAIFISQIVNGGDIRRIDPLLSTFTGSGFTIASEDGSECSSSIPRDGISGRATRSRSTRSSPLATALQVCSPPSRMPTAM